MSGVTGVGRKFAVAVSGLVMLGALVALLANAPATPAASSAERLSTTISVSDALGRSCLRQRTDSGATAIPFDAPSLDGASFSALTASLRGPSRSDWDLTVFDASSGRIVAASTSRGADEVASGYLDGEGGLIVQACRIRGAGESASLSVRAVPVDAGPTERVSMAHVEVNSAVEQQRLQGLGLDLTEHGGRDFIAVVLHGADDRRALDRAGLDYEIAVGDLVRQDANRRAADAAYAREATASALPSGRNTYRRYFHYTQEMKQLATDNPDLVRPVTLPNETWEGRKVEGIEITTNADNIRDGKPVFLQMGVHHAREWPSGEHAMEWAYELINGYKSGNARVRRLVNSVRTIVIPIVNPDGFNASREAGEQQGSGNGEDGSFTTTFPSSPNEYRRKNCRLPDDSPQGNCAQPAFGVASGGVDPNRNYGGFWGGETGSSTVQTDEDYRGPGPFSEPETRNIRSLVSHRQVTVLITNHTFSNLVLRPPGIATQPDPIDEPIYKALGDAMAAQNGYLSQKGYELYDTSGTTEDWSYNATGGLGFTFEIYCNHVPDPLDDRCSGNFHPTFPKTVAEYEGGAGSDAPAGAGGNREAYFLAMEAAGDPAKHSLLTGTAPPGAVLTLEKTFQTPTLEANPADVQDHLETEMVVPGSGKFEYHINPSTRPLVAQSTGRQSQGPPSGPITFGGTPGVGNTPCPGLESNSTDPACYDDQPFVITQTGVDNESATVEIEWAAPATDWDLYVYRDTDGDGTATIPDGPDAGSERDPEPESALVGDSATGAPGTSESTTFVKPEAGDGRLQPGPYVAKVVNFTAADPYTGTVTFGGPEPFVAAKTETWRFSCTYAGQRRITEDVLINRGQRKAFDFSNCGQRIDPQTGDPIITRCKGKIARLVGSQKRNTITGTIRRDVIVAFGGNDTIRSRKGNDLVCAGGGNDTVRGGFGKDRVTSAAGKDRLFGGPARDQLIASKGADRLSGGKGGDLLRGGKGKDRCGGGAGPDRLRGCERGLGKK